MLPRAHDKHHELISFFTKHKKFIVAYFISGLKSAYETRGPYYINLFFSFHYSSLPPHLPLWSLLGTDEAPPPHTQADRPPPSVKDPLSRGLHRRGNQDNHTSHRGVRRSLPESCRLPGRPPWEAPSEGKTADRVRGGRHPRSEEDIRANTRPHVRGRGQVHTL